MAAFVNIDYNDGGNPLNYKHVSLSYKGESKEEKKLFDSGNFVKDWFDMRRFIVLEEINKREHIACSSSVDHFLFDGAPYESAYFHYDENDNPILKYVDHNDKDYLFTQSDIFMNGWEFFVDAGTKPTWEELRVYCGYPPKNI